LNAGLTKDEINKLLDIAKQAAKKGGESLMKNYGRIKTINVRELLEILLLMQILNVKR